MTSAYLLAALLALQSATPNAAANNSSYNSDVDAYEACIDLHSVIFETAKENVSDTVDAIFAACRNERATVVLTVWKQQQQKNPDAKISQAEEFVTELIEKPKRADILVELMRVRSKL